jgi:hypothetical protein
MPVLCRGIVDEAQKQSTQDLLSRLKLDENYLSGYGEVAQLKAQQANPAMTQADSNHERPDPANRWHESVRLAFSYFVLAVIIVSAVIFGFVVLYYALSSEPERVRFFDFIYAHPPTVLGIPASLGSALSIVLLLKTTSGPIEFELIGVKFRGASGQIVMLVFVFLSVILAIKLLWN